ncbi:MAG: YdcF family protein [Actinobacteria bacterium]|nr:YdcF family protein [Actinomycetota bacterium]
MFGFRIIRRVLSALILLALVIPLFTLGKVWTTAHNSQKGKAEVIVVLGAAQFDGRPSGALKARLVEAERLYRLGLAPWIITVGAGAPGDRTTEAAAAKTWLQNRGVPKRSIIAIEKGRDTLVSTKGYIAEMKARKIRKVIIVTDPFHCLRAMTIASDLGVKPSCSPVRTGPNSLVHTNLRYLMRETGAYLAYVTLGRRGIQLSDHLTQ